MIYNIQLYPSIASTDFASFFPLTVTSLNKISDEYYVIGRSHNTFDSEFFTKDFTYLPGETALPGDIALLKDYTFVFLARQLFMKKRVF